MKPAYRNQKLTIDGEEKAGEKSRRRKFFTLRRLHLEDDSRDKRSVSEKLVLFEKFENLERGTQKNSRFPAK